MAYWGIIAERLRYGPGVRKLSEKFPDSAWRLDELIKLPNLEVVKNPTKRQVEKASGLVRDVTNIQVA